MYFHLRRSKLLPLLLLAVFLVQPFHTAAAQDQSTADHPVYIVQAGDTLYEIAARFGVSVDDIILANQITDANLVSEGTRLTIPGLEGVSGVLSTTLIPLGQDLESMARQYQLTKAQLVKLNRITSPAELYAGSTLIIPQSDDRAALSAGGTVPGGSSLLEASVRDGANPWTILLQNDIRDSSAVIPGETLFHTLGENETAASPFSALVESIEISPLPLVQGSTTVISVKTGETLSLSGSLNGKELHFFATEDGYVALQGVHAMAATGPATFTLSGVSADNGSFAFQQNVLLNAGNFYYTYIDDIDPNTLDEENTKPEDELVSGLISPATPEKYWDGAFILPVDIPAGYTYRDCTTDYFGSRRSYNRGPFNFYHTGIDLSICGMQGNIYAPADGVVVYTGSLVVRGNYTVIDHGWGVYSGYGHQAEILVNVGDRVETGQLIGKIGETGRANGPHLHWEIWVNGIVVQPIDWVNQAYP